MLCEESSHKSRPGTEGCSCSDGIKIVFVSARDGNNEIYVMDLDGGNQTRLTNNLVSDRYPSWK